MSTRKLIAQALVVSQLFLLINTLTLATAAQDGQKVPEAIFSNTTSIAIDTAPTLPATIPAVTYPSNIVVSGMTGNITRVAVTLNGLTHARGSDVDLLLVSPTGAKFIFLADASGGFGLAFEDKLFTFADDAPNVMPFSTPDVPSDSYKPNNPDGLNDTFPSPAPPGPYSTAPSSTFASVFNGANPNGTWSLYSVDDTNGGAGSINGGWSLTITTSGAPETFTNSSYIALNDTMMPSNPYGTVINISGQTGVISNLKVGINGFTHGRVWDVDILLVSPNGKGVTIMSDTGGNGAANNVNIVIDDAASQPIPIDSLSSGTYKPTDVGEPFPDTFPAPAPLRPYQVLTGFNALSNFNGFSPNGEWRLYVVDDLGNVSGSISGGWFLDITTTPVVPPAQPACPAAAFAPTNFAAGNTPTNLAVADFNNDTKLDIAVTNQVSNDVSILLGTGTGTFLPQTLVAVGSGPYAVVAGKFNADNNFDLAVANSGSNNVSILLGNGNGTFGAPTNFPVGPSPISIANGDLNNDGNEDLAVANYGGFFTGTVSILLGNGTGGFTTGTTVRTRSQPSFVAITNLSSADANRDLIVTSFSSNSVTTFVGNGNGTFSTGQNLNTGIGPVSIEVTEANGLPYFITANYNGDSTTTCSSTGNGLFTCGTSSAGGANPISVAIADYLGTGSKQPAVAFSGANAVRVFAASVAVGANPNAVKAADFNGDGKIDIVTANSGSNDVTVALNTCSVARGNLFDWDGDRRTDFNIFRPSTQAWYNSSLNGAVAAKYFSRPGDKLVPADYDGDGKTDYGLYRPDAGLWIVHTATTNRPIYFTQFGIAEDIPTPADYDGDGKADIAVFRPSTGTWYIRRSSDNAVNVVPLGSPGDKPVAADYDGDRKDDIAVFRPSTGVWFISQSSNGQMFILQFGSSEDKTVVGDYDGDGKADIAVWRPSTGAWWMRWSSDGGVRAHPWGTSTDIPVVGDFDNDGRFDSAVYRPSDRTWYVVKSSDGTAIYFQWGLSTDYPVPNAYVR
jgi:subtilisin-like proprotein convertase family protein